MINKEKIFKKADKYVKQGKIDHAISEYNKIIDQNPTDLSTINTVGDLYARIGKTTEAITQFKQIAEFYSKDGFNLKAIAIYKKINKLDPSDLENYLKLAELYVRQNLLVEAASHYLVVAQNHASQGNTSDALKMYQKVIELNPHNLKVRVKKADLLIKDKREDEAINEYILVADGFREKGYFEEAELVLEKAKKLSSDSEKIAVLAGQLFLEKGDFGEAEKTFRSILDQNESHTKVLTLLAETYDRDNRIDDAQDCWQKILSIDPENESAITGMGRVALHNQDANSALQCFEPIVDRYSEEEEFDKAFSLIKQVHEVDRTNLKVLQKLLEISTRSGDEERMSGVLDQILEQARSGGDDRLMFTSLRRLVELDPENEVRKQELEEVKQKLDQLGYMEEDIAPTEDLGKKEAAPEFVIEEEELSLEDVEKEFMSEAPDETAPAVEIDEAATEIEEIAPDEAEEILKEAEKIETVEDKPKDDLPVVELTEKEAEGRPPEETISSFMAEVDFYMEQGLHGEARQILDDLEKKFPDHPAIKEKISRLEHSEDGVRPEPSLEKEAPETPAVDAPPDQADEKAEALPDVKPLPDAYGDEDSFDYILKEFREDVNKQLGPDDFENHYNLGIAYKEMNLINEAIDEFQIAAKDPSKVKECCSMIGICFLEKGMPQVSIKWFSKGLDEFKEEESGENYLGMLYYLGMAYEYNGENEKSLETFKKLFKIAPDYRDVKEKIKHLKSGKD